MIHQPAYHCRFENRRRETAWGAGIRFDSGRITAKVPQRGAATGAAPMKHPERVEDYLEHIAEAIERVTGYLQPVPDLEAFKKNGCPCSPLM